MAGFIFHLKKCSFCFPSVIFFNLDLSYKFEGPLIPTFLVYEKYLALNDPGYRTVFETDIDCGKIYRHQLVYINLKKLDITEINHLGKEFKMKTLSVWSCLGFQC